MRSVTIKLSVSFKWFYVGLCIDLEVLQQRLKLAFVVGCGGVVVAYP